MAWSKSVHDAVAAFEKSKSIKVTCGARPDDDAIEEFVTKVARALKVSRDWLKWHRNGKKGIIIDLC